MTDRERKIHVLDLVCSLHGTREELLPEELADLRSLLEDLKKERGPRSEPCECSDVCQKEIIRTDLGVYCVVQRNAPQPSNPERPQN